MKKILIFCFALIATFLHAQDEVRLTPSQIGAYGASDDSIMVTKDGVGHWSDAALVADVLGVTTTTCFTTRELLSKLENNNTVNILWLGDSRTASQFTRGEFRRNIVKKFGHAGFGGLKPNMKYDAWQRGEQGTITLLDLSGNGNLDIVGLASQMAQNSYIRYTPVVDDLCNFTELDVWLLAGNGQVQIDIDGTPYVLDMTGTGVVKKTITGLTDAPHEIYIRSTGASDAFLYELNLKLNQKGVRFHVFGNGGSGMDDQATLISNNYYYADIQPDLTYIRLGVNNIVEQTTDDQVTNLTTIANAIQGVSGQLVVIGEPDNDHPTKSDSLIILNQKYVNFCKSRPAGFVDLFSVVPEWVDFLECWVSE